MIIPVFDVKNNGCVSGQSGKRNTYTRLNSIYGEDPIEIAFNLKKSGARCLYIADLDKIENDGDNSELISKINKILPVILDNGANSIEDIHFNKKICTYSILATETMGSVDDTIEIFKKLPFEKLILSVDIKNNELLVNNSNIKINDIISLVNEVKPDYTILLNISHVGTKKGNGDAFTKEVISKTPYTQHIMAGGITNESIRKYKSEGIDNFLIGTILHDGSMFEEYKW